jgi:tetratricopeptide (TPR) repeat protein
MYCAPANLSTCMSEPASRRFSSRFDAAFNLPALVMLALAGAGCAGGGPLLSPEVQRNTLPASVELEQTPFFPQKDYQCGPAALATVLTYSGIEIAPEQLVDKVYIPARRGSLQVEMLAAARSLGRLPYVLEPELGSLMAELAAGRPVLVLQNLGLSFAPVWHYAVAAGYDAGAEEFMLRSGITERRVMPAGKFSRSWAASNNWAMVVLRPGEVPATPIENKYLQAAAALEVVGQHEAALSAYRAAAEYWPQSSAALFVLGNAHYAAGEMIAAEQSYRRALQQEPENPAVLNNLAQVLLNQDRCVEALEQINRALAASATQPELQDELDDSQATILRRCASDSPARPAGT